MSTREDGHRDTAGNGRYNFSTLPVQYNQNGEIESEAAEILRNQAELMATFEARGATFISEIAVDGVSVSANLNFDPSSPASRRDLSWTVYDLVVQVVEARRDAEYEQESARRAFELQAAAVECHAKINAFLQARDNLTAYRNARRELMRDD